MHDSGDGAKRHIATTRNHPFIVLFEQQCPDEADDGSRGCEDADDIGAPIDLAIEALNRTRRMQLRPMFLEEAHAGEPLANQIILGSVNYPDGWGHAGGGNKANRKFGVNIYLLTSSTPCRHGACQRSTFAGWHTGDRHGCGRLTCESFDL